MTARAPDARLLPWTTDDGRACYVRNGTGWLSEYADVLEGQQLVWGGDLLERATAMLADGKVSETELRFLVARLSEALRDALRVADSRGARLPCDDGNGDDDGDEGPHLPAEAFG